LIHNKAYKIVTSFLADESVWECSDIGRIRGPWRISFKVRMW